MFGNYLIGLREGLEAALVVVILIAYLVKSGRRALISRIWLGVLVAVLVSLAVGAALTFGPKGLTFQAQEAIGGTLSIVAVGLVTWMVFWMARSAQSLAADLRARVDAATGPAVPVTAVGSADASRPGWRLVLVAMLAVGREGLETAIFLWAATRAAAATQGSTVEPLVGALLGLGTAVLLGWAVYRGSLRLNLSRFFTLSGAFLVVIAGGVLAYGVHDLQEARILPGLHHLAFDVSHVIDPGSWPAALLKGIFNFSPATTSLEALAWVLYVIPVLVMFLRTVRGGRSGRRTPAATATSPGQAATDSPGAPTAESNTSAGVMSVDTSAEAVQA